MKCAYAHQIENNPRGNALKGQNTLAQGIALGHGDYPNTQSHNNIPTTQTINNIKAHL